MSSQEYALIFKSALKDGEIGNAREHVGNTNDIVSIGFERDDNAFITTLVGEQSHSLTPSAKMISSPAR